MKKIQKVRIGDVLLIPFDADLFAIGQIILRHDKDFEYIAVFDLFIQQNESPATTEIEKAKVLILVQVSGGVDRVVARGTWSVVNNLPLNQKIKYPEYKILTQDGWFVTNWKREMLRRATENEIALLEFQEAYSPAAITNALRMYKELDLPNPFYNGLIRK